MSPLGRQRDHAAEGVVRTADDRAVALQKRVAGLARSQALAAGAVARAQLGVLELVGELAMVAVGGARDRRAGGGRVDAPDEEAGCGAAAAGEEVADRRERDGVGDRVGAEDTEHAADREGADAVAEEDVALAQRRAVALEVCGLGEAVAAEDARPDLAGAAHRPAVLHGGGGDAEVADAEA